MLAGLQFGGSPWQLAEAESAVPHQMADWKMAGFQKIVGSSVETGVEPQVVAVVVVVVVVVAVAVVVDS